MIPFAGLGGGGLASLLGGAGSAGAGGGLGAMAARFGAPGVAGNVGGAPMVPAMAGRGGTAAGGGFWEKFAQMYGGGTGGQAPMQSGGQADSSNPLTQNFGSQRAQMATGYLDNLENRAGRLGEMLRGPTMPLQPHLYAGPSRPNENMGQIGLAGLLAQIATRRG